MITVVNVRVKYIRPKYQDLQEWCSDPNNVYIGRKGIVFVKDENGNSYRYPPENSKWHNPYKAKDVGANVCQLYREYLILCIKNNYIAEEDFNNLRGKNLGCWCKPNHCHGDIILEFFQEIELLGYENFLKTL